MAQFRVFWGKAYGNRPERSMNFERDTAQIRAVRSQTGQICRGCGSGFRLELEGLEESVPVGRDQVAVGVGKFDGQCVAHAVLLDASHVKRGCGVGHRQRQNVGIAFVAAADVGHLVGRRRRERFRNRSQIRRRLAAWRELDGGKLDAFGALPPTT